MTRLATQRVREAALRRGLTFRVCSRGDDVVFAQGGPYRLRPADVPGVKMAQEIALPCDVDVPTEDFQVPDEGDLWRGLLRGMYLLLRHRQIYVGCMGGVGRTGLYLALLTRVITGKQGMAAITYVRKHYNEHAVETAAQRRMVCGFPVRRLRAAWITMSIFVRPKG